MFSIGVHRFSIDFHRFSIGFHRFSIGLGWFFRKSGDTGIISVGAISLCAFWAPNIKEYFLELVSGADFL